MTAGCLSPAHAGAATVNLSESLVVFVLVAIMETGLPGLAVAQRTMASGRGMKPAIETQPGSVEASRTGEHLTARPVPVCTAYW
jgi:hypothetical protein